MNLAWHQFRKDVRQFRWLLLGLGVILFFDLVQTQGWMARRDWVWPFDSRDLHHFGINWIVGALIGGCGVLAFSSVLGDSPHRENSFIRTRPMPASSLWLGKTLFLGIFVLLPLVLIEAVNLALHGLDASLIWAGTMERLTLVLPVLIVIGAISGSAKDQKTPGVAVAVGYVSGLIGVGLIALALRNGAAGVMNDDVDATSIRYALFGFAASMLIFAVWVVRFRPSAWLRWPVLGICVIAAEFGCMHAPTSSSMPGLAQAEVTERAKDAGYHIPLNRVGTSQTDAEEGVVRLGWTLGPEFDSLPKEWIIRWQKCTAELKTADGKSYQAGSYPGQNIVFRRHYNLAEDDMRNLSGMLPAGAILESQNGHGSRRQMSYRPFHLPPKGEWWNGRADISIQGTANVYQWKQVADLDLKPGASARDGYTQWEIIGVAAIPKSDQIQVVFEQNCVGLQTSEDQDLRVAGRWPANRFEFMIYDPINKLARSTENRYSSTGSVGAHTAFQRRTAILRFQEGDLRQDGWDEHPESLRLLVFRRDFLGSFDKTVSAQIVPSRHRPYYGSSHSNTDRITREDYLLRFNELEPPPAGAPRSVVGNYIHAVLQLVEAYSRTDESDPPIRALTHLVPDYPEVFLDGYLVADSDSRRALFQALRLGLRPDQKSLVIERIDDYPGLTDLLVRRGWHEDARAELFGLIDHHSTLPYSALKALAWLNDPRADERLLRELRDGMGQDAYKILARLPRLADRVDQIVNERWQNRSRHHRTHGTSDYSRALAIRHGKVEAVRDLARILSQHNKNRGSVDSSALSILGPMLDIPGVTRRNWHDWHKIAAALVAVSDRELRYNPVFETYQLVDENSQN